MKGWRGRDCTAGKGEERTPMKWASTKCQQFRAHYSLKDDSIPFIHPFICGIIIRPILEPGMSCFCFVLCFSGCIHTATHSGIHFPPVPVRFTPPDSSSFTFPFSADFSFSFSIFLVAFYIFYGQVGRGRKVTKWYTGLACTVGGAAKGILGAGWVAAAPL